jgi:transglutaminase-like putative cysteine protease
MRWLPILLLTALPLSVLRAATPEEIAQLVTDGHWQQARQEIADDLAQTDLDFSTRQAVAFQSDRMMRIHRDFDKTRAEVFQKVQSVIPDLTDAQFDKWVQDGTVETFMVDGTRWYFDRAGGNLFLINPQAKALGAKTHPDTADHLPYRREDVDEVVSNYDRTGLVRGSPRTWRFTYELSVKPGKVPPGEIIRAWLPYPHEGNRQKNIRLIYTDPPHAILSDTNATIASAYLEKPAATNSPTTFKIIYEFTSDAYYQPIDASRVQPIDIHDPALTPFLGEKAPHIVFSDDIKKLSQEIVGDETNSYLIARRIFAWIAGNVPWASSREYSTMECIPTYVLAHHHGDCGMKSLTFMTLCRLNHIPARWESGWMTSDVADMHDWCEIYLAPYGWVPVDVTYGLVDSANDHEKWFYLGGIDASRFVVNTDYTQTLYPSKTFFRSEIVDFQRGEVEWRGGNLYFNQWYWNADMQEITPPVAARP